MREVRDQPVPSGGASTPLFGTSTPLARASATDSEGQRCSRMPSCM
jgi:hypothetical protein